MENINDISFPNLGINLSNVPSGIQLFGREFKFYALIISFAFLLAIFLADREAKRTNQDSDVYMDAFLVTVLPAVIGARLYYVIFSWDSYKDDWTGVVRIWEGGRGISGGVLAGILALFIFCLARKQHFGLVLDTLVPGLAIGQAIGRWGNFFNREAFGGDSNSLFAMRIPTERIEVAYSSLVTVHNDSDISYIQVHPTFLYESTLCLVIFIILLLYRRKKKVDGEVFLLYAFLYGFGRFMIEHNRTDQLILCTLGETPIPVSQVVAVLFMVLSVVIFIYGRHKLAIRKYLSETE